MRWARLALGVALLLVAVVLAALLATGSASAGEVPEPPPYEGAQSFETIRAASYPEDYSWTVARDAAGESVPTTIAVAAPNVITLVVHHGAGAAVGLRLG